METNKIWTEIHRIEANMVDMEREATWTTIANFCQNAAGNHANFRQLGFYDMQKIGMVWVLNRLKINALRLPKWLDIVRIETWVSAMQPFSHRHYALFDNTTNEPLLYGYSLWIPIDTTSHRPRRIPTSDFDNLLEIDREKGCELPEKLKNTEGGIWTTQRQVQFTDLDLAGHMNNAKYIDWLFDDLFSKGKLEGCKSLTVNYLGETFLGDTIDIFAKKTDTQADYILKKQGSETEILRAKIER
jgi:medium-chain acyl-[acyl-carrier-protein] hydrolase